VYLKTFPFLKKNLCKIDRFLPRDAMRKCCLCCRPVSVRLSVRPSATLAHCILMAEGIVKIISTPGSRITLAFFGCASARLYPIPRGTHSPAAQKYKVFLTILQFSTEIAFCLGNGTR